MVKLILPLIVLVALIFGCAGSQQGATLGQQSSISGGANDFNPYMREKLPNTRQLSSESSRMLDELGGHAQSIEGEARHRKNWREEIYPVVFGDKKAPHEIIVILNFSEPACEQLWSAVVEASRSLQPNQCKIVFYGKSDENYGIDLTGLAIWLAHSRKGQAIPWVSYALSKWNSSKAAQKSTGKVKKFTNEYDSAAKPGDLPIMHSYLARIQPPVPANQELALSKYCYDAGNINMYQATQICKYYGVKKLPAIIVDGKVLGNVSADGILAALQ